MTLGSHQQTVGKSQTHFTPRFIIDALTKHAPFDLDPCAGDPRPWDCATKNITEAQDGLEMPWTGRVWLNPPFDRYQIARWFARMTTHNCGIALVHARTETAWFEPIWDHASLILFLSDRIKFCQADGVPHPANSGAPVVLAAFGLDDAEILDASGLEGAYVERWLNIDRATRPRQRRAWA